MFLIFLLRNYWIGCWLEEHQIEEYWLDNHCIDIHWLVEYYLDKHCLDDHFLNARRTINLQSITYKRCWLYYYYTCITIPTENTNWIKWRRNFLQVVLLFLIYFSFFLSHRWCNFVEKNMYHFFVKYSYWFVWCVLLRQPSITRYYR